MGWKTESRSNAVTRDPYRRVRTLVLEKTRIHRESVATALANSGVLDIIGTGSLSPDALVPTADVVVVHARSLCESERWSRLSTDLPPARIVVYGLDPEEPNVVLRCAEAGAAGYVGSEESLEHLITAIQTVARGELSCSPRIATIVFQHVSTLSSELRNAQVDVLTRRERDVLVLVDEGLTNKEIAVRLGIETCTVKSHVHNVLKKVNVSDRDQAAARVRIASSAGALRVLSASR